MQEGEGIGKVIDPNTPFSTIPFVLECTYTRHGHSPRKYFLICVVFFCLFFVKEAQQANESCSFLLTSGHLLLSYTFHPFVEGLHYL